MDGIRLLGSPRDGIPSGYRVLVTHSNLLTEVGICRAEWLMEIGPRWAGNPCFVQTETQPCWERRIKTLDL